ncbi:hypothetical protein M2650_04165 [Luteimonas sp. SX5]|uniref:Uncharacterized protein n=1 Tax=Luteimonas galliterrae TaxID=2940486 RepID=A0ABT0MGW9_9GAMM|nr:hypothetical protein [Luteimonas galliterrae]MCL1633838.1 hypothetical protein [Luteimonas galliterrae]
MAIKYTSSDDIYRELVEESNQSWLLGLVAFAIVEEQRIEWIKHKLDTTGKRPTSAQIDDWYASQPQSVLIRAKGEAESALEAYGAEAVEEFDATYRKDIENGIVVGAIKDLKRFWPQFFMNLGSGILSSFIFAALLIWLAFLLFNEPSTSDISSKLKQTLELNDGEVRANK